MYAVVINPISGKGKGAALGTEVVGYLRRCKEDYVIVSATNATDLLHNLKTLIETTNIDGIIAVGGDGLVHLVLQVAAPNSIPFTVIPAGTGNDFSRNIGTYQSSVKTIINKCLSTNPSPIDLGLVDSEYFGAILSTGFDSVVNERANSLRWPTGAARYNAAIALELPKFRPISYDLTVDGQSMPIEAMLIAVGNGKSYGAGMNICPGAQLNDGLFDLVILEPVSTFEFIKVFPQVYSGKHISHPQVRTIRAKKVRIEGESIAYADGERIGPAPVSAECIAGAGLTWTL